MLARPESMAVAVSDGDMFLGESSSGLHASSNGKKTTVLTVDSSKEEIVVEAGNMKLKQIMCYALSFSGESVWRKKQALAATNHIGREYSVENATPNSGYMCIGILGIKDPVRPGVREIVAICKAAGMNVRMVTGDNIHTVKATARVCDILTNGIAIEGPAFREKKKNDWKLP
ncbi:hypothetical protein K1719_004979 [Acacia pycnantha]|nr:hypothetical protein K1719_004979 [Acacia pycnantha]